MPPRTKVTLTPGQAELLRAALRESLSDTAGFPAGSDRRERLERWNQRLDERASDDGAFDLRFKGADWDVFMTSLGTALARLRAGTKHDFDRLWEALAAPATTGSADLARAEEDLARLEELEALSRLLKTAVTQEGSRPPRRRWILP